jgi:hypothetical protein
MRSVLPHLIGWSSSGRALRAEAPLAVVRLIERPDRLPGTPIEHRLAAALQDTGPVAFVSLVKRVAADLYADELRNGASVLDIGLYGDRLFKQDVLRELKAGDGILWEIKQDPAIA